MNPNDCLLQFFTELERLVDGHGTRHAIATTQADALEVRLGAGNWYRAVQMDLDEDPVKAAEDAANSESYWPNEI